MGGASDVEAVTARRAAIARELAGVDVARARLQTELEDLSVTERVLKRLDLLLPEDDDVASFPTEFVNEEPVHMRAVGMIKSLLAGRG
jgi:hypothetical protein